MKEVICTERTPINTFLYIASSQRPCECKVVYPDGKDEIASVTVDQKCDIIINHCRKPGSWSFSVFEPNDYLNNGKFKLLILQDKVIP